MESEGLHQPLTLGSGAGQPSGWPVPLRGLARKFRARGLEMFNRLRGLGSDVMIGWVSGAMVGVTLGALGGIDPWVVGGLVWLGFTSLLMRKYFSDQKS